MLEPEKNPTPKLIVDPPAWLRMVLSRRVLRPHADPKRRAARRAKAEARRRRKGEPHTVSYFHQLDDPYAHLAAQVLAEFGKRYDIALKVHLIRATGGNSQPELDKLRIWARRDAELIAPHLGLAFPSHAETQPTPDRQVLAGRALIGAGDAATVGKIAAVSEALWAGDDDALARFATEGASEAELERALDEGSETLQKKGHYSGAMFEYGGEWYWGVDRLHHLELRLRELGACIDPDASFLAPRPRPDVRDVDARALRLDFYPSLNSPYTAIIYDQTIAMKDACGIEFHHKPVLPMVMRGVPAPMPKARYIMFDTQREAEFAGVAFGDLVMPIGTPTRRAYSMLPWAIKEGRDEALMSSLLRHAFALGVGLHKEAGMRRAVEAAGLDWAAAQSVLGSDDWKPMVERNQDEMVDGLGLWGVPCYKLSGPAGESDIAVWGQDRLWLIAAEILRRAAINTARKASPGVEE